jgi:hypothetical protein
LIAEGLTVTGKASDQSAYAVSIRIRRAFASSRLGKEICNRPFAWTARAFSWSIEAGKANTRLKEPSAISRTWYCPDGKRDLHVEPIFILANVASGDPVVTTGARFAERFIKESIDLPI